MAFYVTNRYTLIEQIFSISRGWDFVALDLLQRGSTPVGRGRAKAKQIKVARKLKYYSPETDLNALQRELGGESADHTDPYDQYDEDPDYSAYADKYADYGEDHEDEDEQRA